MLVVGLVGQVPDGQAQALVLGEGPGGAQVGRHEAGGGVLGAAGEAGGDAILAVDQAQREVGLYAGQHVTQPAEAGFVGRHLEQRLVEVVVGAAHHRVAGAQPVAGNDLPAGIGFEPVDRHAAQVHGLLAVGGIGSAASRRGGGAGQDLAGQVVLDAVVIAGHLVDELAAGTLDAQLELVGLLGFHLGAAGVEIAVAADAGFVTLAHARGAEGAGVVGVGAEQRRNLVDGAEAAREGVVGAIQPGRAGAVEHAVGARLDRVVAQAGQHIQFAEAHVVLHVGADGGDLGVLEGVVGAEGREVGGGCLPAIRVAGHFPGIDAKGHEMLRMHQPVGLGVDAVGLEGNLVGDDVAVQPVGVAVDLAFHFLAIDAHVEVERLLAAALAAVAQFEQAALLLRRMDNGRAGGRVGRVALDRTRVPDILVLVQLRRDANLLLVVEAEAVLADEAVGIVAGAGDGAFRRLVVVDAGQRGADHQGVVASAGIHYRRAAHALAGRIEGSAGLDADTRREAGLRQQNVDRAAQRAGAVKHRGAALDHLDPLGHAERHE